ncbi:MAG: CRISPR-associated endonuclease Cas2 [Candidatus Freyarchaeota archaeon]|nr:CRISPR-associated endonuclease Cas2 [Candidatus Jordarchaeia archaeon]
MKYLIIYDVTDDRLRGLVAETLKDYGLHRVQYSAFVGNLTRSKLNSLIVDLEKLFDGSNENVQIYPLCEVCFRGRRIIGRKRHMVDDGCKPKSAYF